MKDERIADLTVDQLQALIRETVQQAMTEVLIEFAAAAEMDARLSYEAEMVDYMRASLQGKMPVIPDETLSWELDD